MKIFEIEYKKLSTFVVYFTTFFIITGLFIDAFIFKSPIHSVHILNVANFIVAAILTCLMFFRVIKHTNCFLVNAYLISINIYISGFLFNFSAVQNNNQFGIEYGIVVFIFMFLSPFVGKKEHTLVFGVLHGINLILSLIFGFRNVHQLVIYTFSLLPFVFLVYYIFNLLEKSIAENEAKTITISKQNEELKQQNHQLEELQSFKEEITHTIAHDLRNSLNTIVNISRQENKNHLFSRIFHQSEFSLRLISNLLDIRRLEETKMPLLIEEFSLNEIIRSAIEKVEYWTETYNISIDVETEKEYFVKADANITKRILVNLLENAIKASKNNSKIIIEIQIKDNQTVSVCVKDFGHGISKEKIKQIVDFYKKTDFNKHKKMLSSGLGLAFCSLATQQQGGKLFVKSSDENGTTICFSVPLFKSDNLIKSFQPKQSESINPKEIELLNKIKSQLINLQCHQAKAIFDVLNTIPQNASGFLNNWKNKISNCVYTGNNKEFKNLLK